MGQRTGQSSHIRESIRARTYSNRLMVLKAGLFSAIVTTFAVQSLQSLQADPAGVSVILLAQISQQLASFSVSPTFINSTAAFDQASMDPQSPESSDIVINTLWILSLTLSLLSAFFAIVAQQWLRALAVPGHLSIGSTIRLRHRRQTSFAFFQIPHIIRSYPRCYRVRSSYF